jgi:hypothetical protein
MALSTINGNLTPAQLDELKNDLGVIDTESLTNTYLVKTAFSGASVGDVISITHIIDVAGGGYNITSTMWRNETTSTNLVAAPSHANLTLIGSNGLTDTQLRATPITIDSVAIGTVTDAPASSDGTGNYGLLSALKRGLLNWTSLFTRIPTSLGAKDSASSFPVVLANNQATIPARDTNGSGAVIYTTDTAAVTGNFAQIHCLTSTTFSVLTRTNGTGTLTGISLPAGTLLIGPFTAYTLTSGTVAAYS